MKNFIQIILNIVIPIVLFVQPTLGQQQSKINADNVQKTILLDEVKAVLADNDNSVTVKAILGRKDDTELKRGDIIFMAQGVPVGSISHLLKIYDKTGKGDEFKMAVKRGDKKFLTSFDIDPESETGREMFTGTMKFSTNNANTSSLDVIPELLIYGVMASGSDNGFVIKKTMPNLDSSLRELGINDGDKIVSVDGKKVSSHQEFKQVWENIAEGENVELEFNKDGQIVPVSLSKKSANGKVIFKKEG